MMSVGRILVIRPTRISSPVPKTQPGVLMTRGQLGKFDSRLR